MKKGVGNFNYAKVDISKPHFLISWSDTYDSTWRPISLLSLASTVDAMRLSLLTSNPDDLHALDMMHRELNFLLIELHNPDPGSYLCYHCGTLSNVAYNNIHFTFVENINKNNILYYIRTESKLIGIYNNPAVTNMQERYMDVVVDALFGKVLNTVNPNEVIVYNEILFKMLNLIFVQIPNIKNFRITEPLTLIEFSKWLSTLEILDFLNILNYLRKIKLLKIADIKPLLKFYYLNQGQYQVLQNVNS